jgi:hypothetical protein
MDPSDVQREILREMPATLVDIGEALGLTKSTVEYHVHERLKPNGFAFDIDESSFEWSVAETPAGFDIGADADASDAAAEDDNTSGLPDLDETPVADADPDVSDLTDDERRIARELQTGVDSIDTLADQLDDRPSVITQRLRDLRSRGWHVYVDETAAHIAIEGDATLRSSEHIGTRTRKANRWWERRHNQLVREYKGLPDVPSSVDTERHRDAEDWVVHLTDVHAGDFVRQDDGTVVYEPDLVPDVIDYAARRSLHLADVHGAAYDHAYILLGGDLVTGEGVYEGQLENGDVQAYMDEQIDMLHDPLLRLLDGYHDRFESVTVVCQIGNHGDMRASGTSKRANADLIAYKNLRNTVSALRDRHGEFENLAFKIGEARAYRNFELRGGELRGHLRHGQDRDPQATTSARMKEWLSTLMDHDFDIAYLGHHHVSGVIPWDGPPIVATGSPKPSGEFVERLGVGVPSRFQPVATCHGVSDAGLTGLYPIDDRAFERTTES